MTAVSSSGKRLFSPCAAIAAPPTPVIVMLSPATRFQSGHQLTAKLVARRFAANEHQRQRLRPEACSRRHADDEQAEPVGLVGHRALAHDQGSARFHGDTGQADRSGVAHRLHADDGQIGFSVLDRLWRLRRERRGVWRACREYVPADWRCARSSRRFLRPLPPQASDRRRQPPPGRHRVRPARAPL